MQYKCSKWFFILICIILGCNGENGASNPSTASPTVIASTSSANGDSDNLTTTPENESATEEFIESLRNTGALIEVAETVSQRSTFGVDSLVIYVNGGHVQIFEYASTEDKQKVKSLIYSDGYKIGNTIHDWIDTPHFFDEDKLLVLYLGTDSEILTIMENLLGEQFAGG